MKAAEKVLCTRMEIVVNPIVKICSTYSIKKVSLTIITPTLELPSHSLKQELGCVCAERTVLAGFLKSSKEYISHMDKNRSTDCSKVKPGSIVEASQLHP